MVVVVAAAGGMLTDDGGGGGGDGGDAGPSSSGDWSASAVTVAMRGGNRPVSLLLLRATAPRESVGNGAVAEVEKSTRRSTRGHRRTMDRGSCENFLRRALPSDVKIIQQDGSSSEDPSQQHTGIRLLRPLIMGGEKTQKEREKSFLPASSLTKPLLTRRENLQLFSAGVQIGREKSLFS
jgi:hypothetical protein